MQYYQKTDYEAWLHGQYSLAAFSVVMANAFAKSGSQKAEYPKWKNPMEKYMKPKEIKLDNKAESKRQIEWFASLFNG